LGQKVHIYHLSDDDDDDDDDGDVAWFQAASGRLATHKGFNSLPQHGKAVLLFSSSLPLLQICRRLFCSLAVFVLPGG
jgi:hypothetical protein